MRVVILEPGQLWPRIVHLEDISSIRVTVGGYLDSRPIYHSRHNLRIITRLDAEATGAPPNRIVDGHLLYGTIVVCSAGFDGLPLPVAKDLQSDCEWPIAQLEAHDKPA